MGAQPQPFSGQAQRGVHRRHLSHPAAPMLFIDFLLTDGQKLLKSVNRIPSVTTEGDSLAGLELIEAPEEGPAPHSAEWRDRYPEVTMRASQ